jgi:predicted ATPase/class 3 adenylate cyclase
MIACASCGFEAPDDFAFCPKCATPLAAPPAIPEERKTVTTLFCDVVAFTAMSEGADPEDVDALLGEYFARATRVIESHGGIVEKFIGDAVVGVFGVPSAHEDDAERAIRAGLRILEALEGMKRPDGEALEARCGVNTGEALVRLDITPNSGEGFLTGDAVNTAARLQAAAPPMAVAVGPLTHELTERVIVFEKLSHVSAKGKTNPVPAWRALRPLARTGLRTGGISTTPFIGREDESASLRDAFDEVTSTGEGRIVLVVGEPGIGKSRLVLEFARSVDERPEMVTWRQGRCLPYGEGIVFSALSEILKEHAGILDSDEVAVVESKLGAVLPDSDEGTWLRQRLRPLLGLSSAQAAREESFAAWTRFLQLVALPGPAVLVLEDLHWAGAEMLEFVEHLSTRALESPVLVIATTRPELLERHQGTLTSEGDDCPRRITLTALARSEAGLLVADLLVDLSGGNPVKDLGSRVVDRVGGNPLYAEQYVRLLLDGDLLTRTRADGHLETDVELPVPVTVQAVIAARLDALPADHKAILCDAAVIGETFWLGGVAAVSGRDVGTIDEAMATLAVQGFVRPVVTSAIEGESEYLFWHALARDVAYGGLPRKARARKHEATADWLEAAAGGRGEFAEVVAHHFVTALDLARATGDRAQADSLVGPTIEALTRAGERALRLDVAAAERHFAGALELAATDDGQRRRILPGWAETLLLRNRYREAAAAYEEAIAGFSASGDIRAAALAMVWLVDVLSALGEPSSNLMRAAVDLLADDGPSAELAEVLSHYALGLTIQDADASSVLEAADRAIETCRLLALPESAVALSCRGGARLLLGDHAGLADVERAVAVAASQGLGIERATLEINLSSQLFAVRGALAERAALVEAHEFVRRHGIDVHELSCRGALVNSLYKTGDWDEALDQAALLLPELEAIEHIWNLLYLRSLQALLASGRGRPAEAARFVGWLVEEGRESEVGWVRACTLLAASTVHLQAGDTETALDLLAQCFSEPRASISITDMVPEAVRTAIAADSDTLGAGIVRQVESLLPQARLPLEQHVVASIHGLMEQRGREYVAAAAHFADAAAGWHDFGVPYEEGQALLGQGRCLVALGRSSEPIAPLAAAREIFARLGAVPALAEADDWLAQVGAV